MKIGILSPISIRELAEYLEHDINELPVGLESKIVTELVKKFIEFGHTVVVFTLDKTIDKDMVIKGKKLTVCVGKYRKRAKIRALDFFLYERRQLEGFLKKYPCDLYNAHWTYEFALPAIKMFPNKTIVTVRDWAPKILKLNFGYYRFVRCLMNNYVIKKAKFLITNSPYIYEKLQNKIGSNDEKKIYIIPNGINENNIYNKVREKNDNLVIIAINNGFSNVKNVKNSIIVFQKVKKYYNNAKLILIGAEYGIGDKAYEWSKKNNYLEGIVFKGKESNDKVIEDLRKADILLHLSREESFGGVIIEAMSQGTPVIGGNKSGAVPWILNNGHNGLLCDVDDIDDILSSILKLFNNNDLWEKMSSEGYKLVKSKFTISNIARKYLEVYLQR